MSQVISACISLRLVLLSPCFIANIFPYFGSPHDNSLHITYSRIISHVISRVSSSDTSFSSLSPPFSPLKCVRSFLRSTPHSFRTLDIRSIYFFSGFFTPLSRLFSSRLLLPPSRPTSCSTYDGGTQLHYRQQLRLEASATLGPRSDK